MLKPKQLIRENSSLFKFIVVGGASSCVHWCISWWMYYHVLMGATLLSTLSGYAGGWVCSYLGNRMWSFRADAQGSSVPGTATRFVISQGISAAILLVSTWIVQQLIQLYFYWYIITNHVEQTSTLDAFCHGASYPPALFAGMAAAALGSYLLMRRFVFPEKNKEHP